jgi:hypothetical protein
LKPIARPDGYESTQYQYRPGMGKGRGGAGKTHTFSPLYKDYLVYSKVYTTPRRPTYISSIKFHHVLKLLFT